MWTQEKVLQLAELLHAAPCLWDMSLREYREKAKKSEAIEFIAAQLNSEQAEIITKIRSLKTQFSREQARKKAGFGKSGDAEVSADDKEWFAYNQLTFLTKNNKQLGGCDIVQWRFVFLYNYLITLPLLLQRL